MYGDFALFLPKNSMIFVGQGLTERMTGLSIQGDDSNFCNFLASGNSKLIRKVRHQTIGDAKRQNIILIQPCNEIKYFFCTKHQDTSVETDNEKSIDNTITTHSHQHTHDDADDNSTDKEQWLQ